MHTSKLPSISVVIRAYNEAPLLKELLQSIKKQEYPFEKIQIIVVNNGSTDTTAELATQFGADLVTLKQQDFTYPKSLNLGFSQAKHEIVFSFSGHCLLYGTHFFQPAIERMQDPYVVGVFGIYLPRKPITMSEFFYGYPLWWRDIFFGSRKVTAERAGGMSAANAAFRLSTWKDHPFDEAYGAGGEDTAWIIWAVNQGKTIWRDSHMTVRHSHQNTIFSIIKQMRLWGSFKQPRPFDPKDLEFRRDLKKKRV